MPRDDFSSFSGIDPSELTEDFLEENAILEEENEQDDNQDLAELWDSIDNEEPNPPTVSDAVPDKAHPDDVSEQREEEEKKNRLSLIGDFIKDRFNSLAYRLSYLKVRIFEGKEAATAFRLQAEANYASMHASKTQEETESVVPEGNAIEGQPEESEKAENNSISEEEQDAHQEQSQVPEPITPPIEQPAEPTEDKSVPIPPENIDEKPERKTVPKPSTPSFEDKLKQLTEKYGLEYGKCDVKNTYWVSYPGCKNDLIVMLDKGKIFAEKYDDVKNGFNPTEKPVTLDELDKIIKRFPIEVYSFHKLATFMDDIGVDYKYYKGNIHERNATFGVSSHGMNFKVEHVGKNQFLLQNDGKEETLDSKKLTEAVNKIVDQARCKEFDQIKEVAEKYKDFKVEQKPFSITIINPRTNKASVINMESAGTFKYSSCEYYHNVQGDFTFKEKRSRSGLFLDKDYLKILEGILQKLKNKEVPIEDIESIDKEFANATAERVDSPSPPKEVINEEEPASGPQFASQDSENIVINEDSSFEEPSVFEQIKGYFADQNMLFEQFSATQITSDYTDSFLQIFEDSPNTISVELYEHDKDGISNMIKDAYFEDFEEAKAAINKMLCVPEKENEVVSIDVDELDYE